MSDKTKGRPAGAKNVKETQLVQTPACPWCKITDRSAYRFVSAVAHGGVRADGTPYSHVVARRCQCLGCGKRRIDKFFENRVPDANPGDEDEPDK